MRHLKNSFIISIFILLLSGCADNLDDSALTDALNRGHALYDAAKNPEEMATAITAYNDALEIDPRSAQAYLGLGKAYADIMMVRYYWAPRDEAGALEAGELASQALLRAIELQPSLIDAYAWLSNVYRVPGRYAETVELLNKGLKVNPENVRLLTLLGRALFDLGRPGDAQRPLRRANEIGAIPLTYRYLGWTDFHLGRFDDQLLWFQKYVAEQPLNDQGQGGVILAYVGKGDYANATSYAEKLVNEHSEHRMFHRFLSKAGEAHLFAGNLEESTKFYERAIAIDVLSDNQYSVRLASTTLGFLYLKAGRDEEAKALINRTIKEMKNKISNGDERWERRYDLASAYAVVGQHEIALDWLESAVNAGLPAPVFVNKDPLWADLKENSDFQALLTRVEMRISEQRNIANMPWEN